MTANAEVFGFGYKDEKETVYLIKIHFLKLNKKI